MATENRVTLKDALESVWAWRMSQLKEEASPLDCSADMYADDSDTFTSRDHIADTMAVLAEQVAEEGEWVEDVFIDLATACAASDIEESESPKEERARYIDAFKKSLDSKLSEETKWSI